VGNSSVKLQETVDDARSFGELAPVLPTGGFVANPALSIANDVMQQMIQGGPDGQPFNWKWNRAAETPFFLNSWQQDYFIPGLVTLGWLESCIATNFSTTVAPKQVYPVEVKRDLLITSSQNSGTAKICFMQNSTMIAGTWGQAATASTTGLTNPGPGVVITDPNNNITMPINPILQVKDSFNNLWVVTTYGTCGNSNPFATNQMPTDPTDPTYPGYPTLQDQDIAAVTVTDGTVVWTAINPFGQGYRINPIPGQTGPVWQISPVGQNRVPRLTELGDYLNPIPDDYYQFFKQGFFAQCYRRSADPKVRAMFPGEYAMWQKALDNAVKQGAREMDDWGFYPTSQIMETGSSFFQNSPAYPYGPWGTAY
jgi:hypothetical protein